MKRDIFLKGEKGKLVVSTGEVYSIPDLKKGFCIVKASGIPVNCEF